MNVTVVLLDGGQFEVQNLRKDTLGNDIFKNACNKIGLTDETEYFGLRFVNKKDGEFEWVDNERSLKSQLGKEANDNLMHYLHFAVKFFPINPTNIKNDLTRYQFVLQLRESLLNGRMECSLPIYALLGSFIAQAEFGDYDSGDISPNYLDDFKVCPDQPAELTGKMKDYHRRHKGMTPEQAELNFLDNVRKLPMYGVHRHLALDVNCEKVFIGVSNIGVTVYRGNSLLSTFVWPKILSLGFKSKKFYIKIKPADEDDDFCKTSVGFKLSDRVAAKRLWKICVEYHTFFRLENVGLAEKKGWLSRFGSRFSYRGKTEHEIMKEEPKPTEEPFTRVSSKRFSERVLKGNRRQPQETTPETEAKESPKKDTKSEQEIPSPVPAIEVEEAAVASTSDDVEATPEVACLDKLPEIKVVQPSPELKVKSQQDGGEVDAEETQGERTEEKEDRAKEGDEEEETNEQPSKEAVRGDDVPLSSEETQIIISNPLAGGEVKSYTSDSITTSTYTTQSSGADASEETTVSSTVISSTQVVTQETRTQHVVTTTSTTETVVESSQNEGGATGGNDE